MWLTGFLCLFFSEDRTLLFQEKLGGASMHKLQYRIIAETDVLLSKLFSTTSSPDGGAAPYIPAQPKTFSSEA
jgi:hypothetical protein